MCIGVPGSVCVSPHRIPSRLTVLCAVAAAEGEATHIQVSVWLPLTQTCTWYPWGTPADIVERHGQANLETCKWLPWRDSSPNGTHLHV